MKSRSISLRRARKAARLVKLESEKQGKVSRRKIGRKSTASTVSPAFVERYLGHFGTGPAGAGATATRATRRKSASKKVERKSR